MLLIVFVCSDDSVSSYPAPDEPDTIDDWMTVRLAELMSSDAAASVSVFTEPGQPDDDDDDDANVQPVDRTELAAAADDLDNVSSFPDADEPDMQPVSYDERVSDVMGEPNQQDSADDQQPFRSTESPEWSTDDVSPAESAPDADEPAGQPVADEEAKDYKPFCSTEMESNDDICSAAAEQSVDVDKPVTDDIMDDADYEPICSTDDMSPYAAADQPVDAGETVADEAEDDDFKNTCINLPEWSTDDVSPAESAPDADEPATAGQPVADEEAEDADYKPFYSTKIESSDVTEDIRSAAAKQSLDVDKPVTDDIKDDADYEAVCSTDDVSPYAAADQRVDAGETVADEAEDDDFKPVCSTESPKRSTDDVSPAESAPDADEPAGQPVTDEEAEDAYYKPFCSTEIEVSNVDKPLTDGIMVDTDYEPICSSDNVSPYAAADQPDEPVADEAEDADYKPVCSIPLHYATAEQTLDADEPLADGVTAEPCDADHQQPVSSTELQWSADVSIDVPCATAEQSLDADEPLTDEPCDANDLQPVYGTDDVLPLATAESPHDADEPIREAPDNADYEPVCISDVSGYLPCASAVDDANIRPVCSTEPLQISADNVSLYATADQPEDGTPECDGVGATSDALENSNGEVDVMTGETHDGVAACGESGGAGDTTHDYKLTTVEDGNADSETKVDEC